MLKPNVITLLILPVLLLSCGKKKSSQRSETTPMQPKTKVVKLATLPELNTTKEKIVYIKEVYGGIKYTEKFYVKKDVDEDYEDEVAALGAFVIYTNNGELVKIDIEAGDDGLFSNVEYYFKNGRLFFVFNDRSGEVTSYNDDGFPNYKVEEDRYYFYDNKMIKWIDSTKESVSNHTPQFQETEEFYLSKAQELLDTYNKPNEKTFESSILDIKETFGGINYAYKFYTKKHTHWIADGCEGDCPQSGKITAFLNGTNLRKLVYRNSRTTYEFYYNYGSTPDERSLAFVFTTYGHKKHERYYYDDGTLIKYIGSDGNQITDENELLQYDMIMRRMEQTFISDLENKKIIKDNNMEYYE